MVVALVLGERVYMSGVGRSNQSSVTDRYLRLHAATYHQLLEMRSGIKLEEACDNADPAQNKYQPTADEVAFISGTRPHPKPNPQPPT